jgi:hypothetical protein
MKKTGWFVFALLAVVCVSLAAPATADAQSCSLRDRRAPWSGSDFSGTCRDLTQWAGGRGGSSFDLACGGNEVLIGIRARADSYVHSVEALCVRVDPRTGAWTSSPLARGMAGGAGGATVDMRCNQNEAVTGLNGRAGVYIDRLQIRCRSLGTNAVATGSTRPRAFAGGSGGSSFSDDCGNNMPGTRLRGKSGIWIDGVSLGCSWVLPGTFSLSSPGFNARLTTRTPTFAWGRSNGATTASIDITQVVPRGERRAFNVSPNTTTYAWPAGQWPFASGSTVTWRVRQCNANVCREEARQAFSP